MRLERGGYLEVSVGNSGRERTQECAWECLWVCLEAGKGAGVGGKQCISSLGQVGGEEEVCQTLAKEAGGSG